MAVATNNFIFYHVPKTGGTWVKVALEAAGVRTWAVHTTGGPHPFNLKWAHSCPGTVPERSREGRFSFCFVRRPVPWYTSYWAFRSRKGARRDENFPADGLWSDDFDQFVNNLLDAHPGGFVSALYQYYTGPDCSGVDFVGRQESLADDLVRALTLAGESFDEEALRATGRCNRSPGKLKKLCVLSDATRARVAECERWILETFYGGGQD